MRFCELLLCTYALPFSLPLAGAPSAEVSAAHWRALQSLAQLAAAASLPAPAHGPALQALQQLAEGSLQSLPDLPAASLDLSAALVPGLQQMQAAPAADGYPPSQARAGGEAVWGRRTGGACQCWCLPLARSTRAAASLSGPVLQDPFALLLYLLAALLSSPGGGDAEAALSCRAHRQPAAVLRTLLALLYPVAAGQAVALATGSSRPVAQAAAAAAASPPLASALEGAASSQLLPWLQRASLLLALLSGAAAPPAADVSGGSAGPAAAALAASLGLPSLQAALQASAAGALPPPPGTPVWQLPAAMQLSVHAAQRQWAVAVPPLPQAAKLLQLPASYQVGGL